MQTNEGLPFGIAVCVVVGKKTSNPPRLHPLDFSLKYGLPKVLHDEKVVSDF